MERSFNEIKWQSHHLEGSIKKTTDKEEELGAKAENY